MTTRRRQMLFVLGFLSPAFVLFTVFVALPGLRALAYSLYKWDGFSTARWVGLGNFATLLEQRDGFWLALKHNAGLVAASGTLTMALALLFASLLHRRVAGAAVFRIAFFFPNVISSVAIALLWMLLYSTTSFGVINGLLAYIGRVTGWMPVSLPYAFMDSNHVLYSIVPMTVWAGTGFYMVLFLAAMEGIPEDYYEAARLDGASAWSQFRHITLPLIREVFTVGMVFMVIGGLKMFDAVWVMENQFPSKESHVLATLLYQKVFSEYDVGYGSAIAVMLFLLIFALTLVTLRLSRREAIEY